MNADIANAHFTLTDTQGNPCNATLSAREKSNRIMNWGWDPGETFNATETNQLYSMNVTLTKDQIEDLSLVNNITDYESFHQSLINLLQTKSVTSLADFAQKGLSTFCTTSGLTYPRYALNCTVGEGDNATTIRGNASIMLTAIRALSFATMTKYENFDTLPAIERLQNIISEVFSLIPDDEKHDLATKQAAEEHLQKYIQEVNDRLLHLGSGAINRAFQTMVGFVNKDGESTVIDGQFRAESDNWLPLLWFMDDGCACSSLPQVYSHHQS